MFNFDIVADSAEAIDAAPLKLAGAPVSTEDGAYQPAIWAADGGGYHYGYATPDDRFVTFSPVESDRSRALMTARAMTVRMVLPR